MGLPLVASVAIYFFSQYQMLHDKEITLLEKEIKFLQEKNSSMTYKESWAELVSQEKIYERKLNNINAKLLKITNRLKLSGIEVQTKHRLLKKTNASLESRTALLKDFIKIGKDYEMLNNQILISFTRKKELLSKTEKLVKAHSKAMKIMLSIISNSAKKNGCWPFLEPKEITYLKEMAYYLKEFPEKITDEDELNYFKPCVKSLY